MNRALPQVAARVAFAVPLDLAEGPRWDAPRDRLLWVDIRAGHVYTGTLDGTRILARSRLDFDSSVGAVAVAEDGTLLVAARERLVVVAPDGTRTDGPRLTGDDTGRHRLNDGACDPQGRFVVGTCTPDDSPSECELLVRLEHDGSITVLDDDLTLSNGLAWSTDGTRLFSVDTMRGLVYVRDYGPDGIGPRSVHLPVDDAHPDGIAVDADDHLWVALWGAGRVRRYDPDGRPVAEVVVPAPHTSAVTFAGPDLRTLVVTSATKDLSPQQRVAHPSSGMLFAARVDVPGLPATCWRNTCT